METKSVPGCYGMSLEVTVPVKINLFGCHSAFFFY